MKDQMEFDTISTVYSALKTYWDKSTDNHIMRDKYKGGAIIARLTLGNELIDLWEKTDFQKFTLGN